MKNPTICIIKTHNKDGEKHFGIDEKDWTTDFLSHYNLKDNIEDYVQLVKLNTIYDLYTSINVMVNPTDQHVVNIEDMHYTSDYVFQSIFKNVAKDTQCSYNSLIEDSNKLATQMLGEKHIVDGNMIIIKRSIINKDFEYEDVTFEDITDIIRNQIMHKAVIIKTSGEIDEQYYVYNPLDINFGQSNMDNVRYHEFKFLDFRLFFHVDTKSNETQINKIASGIYGQTIYGNVLISLSDNSDSSPLNLDMTDELIRRIYTVTMYHRQNNSEIDRKKYSRPLEISNREIEDYDPAKHTSFQHNGFPEVTLCPNFFQIIKLEYNEIKNKFTDYDIKFDSVLNYII